MIGVGLRLLTGQEAEQATVVLREDMDKAQSNPEVSSTLPSVSSLIVPTHIQLGHKWIVTADLLIQVQLEISLIMHLLPRWVWD